jgi:aerobic-type carbon monoxide dehydrogenase small subunit (CoxS/CutS family)
MARIIELQVNGTTHRLQIDPERTLLSVLRDELDLTGTKYGCGEAQCGACTVLIDSKPARSCVTRAVQVEGKKITTIEGLKKNGRLHPMQEAFLNADAMQCAYCTSGMILSAVGLLTENPHPSREEIIDYMEGNVCRCGTYARIIHAIQTAAGTNNSGRK